MGWQDETWWSRLLAPQGHAWMEPEHPVRAVERSQPAGDSDPKALACYGLLVSCPADPAWAEEQVWLRFVDGRPLSGITTQFLDWCCGKLAALGKTALLMPWDNAPWHVSHLVQDWIHEHNRTVKQAGQGVRIIACPLPTKSPWLNPIEPHWMHGKRAVATSDGLLSADDLAERVCLHFQCTHEPHLALTDEEP